MLHGQNDILIYGPMALIILCTLIGFLRVLRIVSLGLKKYFEKKCECWTKFCSPIMFIEILVAASENQQFAYAKTKAQISCAVTAQLNCAVTAQLISAFVIATRILIVPFLCYLYPKFQASNVLL